MSRCGWCGGRWPCVEHGPVATTCMLVGAWSLVRVDDLLTAACGVVVVLLSSYLLLPREGGG